MPLPGPTVQQLSMPRPPTLPQPLTDPLSSAITQMQFGMGTGAGAGMGSTGGVGATLGAYSTSPVSQYMEAQRQQLLARAGLPADADPNAYTPEEATAQLDTAIAKVATINPDLAKSLEEARKAGVEPNKGFGEGIPLLGGVIGLAKDTLGTAWNFATGVGRIIPELIVDKEDPWWEDIGQALTGKSHANFNAVIQKFTGTKSNPFTAALGFGLDVLADPLTWIGSGALNVGRGATNIIAGKATGVSLLRNAEEATVKELLKASGSANLDEMLTKATQMGTAGILGKLNPEAVAGHLFQDISTKGAELWARTWRAMDEVSVIARKGSLKDLLRLAKRDGTVTLPSGEVIRPKQIFELLELDRAAGGMTGRAAAAAMGGIRIRAGMPFSDLRYTSRELPGLSNASFQSLRRFFTGDAGLTLLSRRIAKGVKGVGPDDYFRFLKGGWKEAHAANPDVLGRWGHGFGSAVFTMSEKVGGLTARLTPHSSALRMGGLTGAMVAQHVSKQKYWRNDFIENIGMQVKDDPAIGSVDRKKFTEALMGLQKLTGEANDEAWNLLDLLPTGNVTNVQGKLVRAVDDPDAWGLANGMEPGEVQVLKDQIEKVRALSGQETIDHLWWTKVAKSRARDEGMTVGADMGHWEHNAMTAPSVRPEQRDLVDGDSIYKGRRFFLQHNDPNRGATILQRGVKSADMVHGSTIGQPARGRALHLIEDAPGVDGVEVAVRILPGENGTIDEAWEEAARRADSAYDDYNPKGMDGEAEDVIGKGREPAVDDHLTEFAGKRGNRVVEWTDDQGRVHLAVFDADRVQAISSKAANVKHNRGYADRVLHREWLKMLRGEDTGGRVQARVQDTARSMVRETGHLSREEAARMIHEQAIKGGWDPGDFGDIPVWETDLARAHVQYMQDAANTVIRRAGGNMVEELARWGAPIGPGTFGDAVEDTVYNGARSLGLRVLRGLSKKVQKANAQYDTLAEKAEDDLIRHAMDQAEQMAKLAARHGDLVETAPRAFREEFDAALGEAQMLKQMLDDAKKAGAPGVKRSVDQIKVDLEAAKDRLRSLIAESGRVRPGLRLPKGVKAVDDSEYIGRPALKLVDDKGNRLGGVEWEETADNFIIRSIRVEETRGGLGTQLYLRVAAAAKRKGKVLISDTEMSDDAIRTWESFVSRGWAEKFVTPVGGAPVDGPNRRFYNGPAGLKAVNIPRYRMHNPPKLTAPTGARTRREIFAPVLKELGVNLENIDTILRNAEQAMQEVNRYRAMMHTEEAAPKLAMVTEKGLKDRRGWMPVDFPDMTGRGTDRFWMPAPLAQEFHNLIAKHKDYNGLRTFFRNTVMPKWKTWATVMYPGFHFRNAYGALFNNFLSGMGPREMTESFRIQRAMQGKEKWANQVVSAETMKMYGLGQYKKMAKNPELGFTYADWGKLAQDTQLIGVNAGPLGDIYAHAEGGTTGWRNRNKTALGKKTTGFIEGWKDFGGKAMTVTETYARLGAWTTGLRTFGGDLGQARMFTMSRHGDYVDLNDFEMGAVRDILPFYKWMRTNTPLQIHALFESPGKTLLWPKLRDFFWGAQGYDREEYQKYMPSWMRDQFSIPIPLGKGPDDVMQLMTFDLPMSDLHKGMNEYLSSAIPVLRPFIEAFILEKSIFTGAPLEDKYVPMGGPMKVMGPVLGAIGLAQRNTEGQWEMLQKHEHILTGVPIYTKARNWITADPERAEKRMGAFMSSLFGLNTRPLDEQDLTGVELQYYFTHVQPLISQLKSLGAPLPTKDDLDPSLFAALGYDLPETKEAK